MTGGVVLFTLTLLLYAHIPGDVPELQVEHNGITSAAGVIRVRTPVQGSSNIW